MRSIIILSVLACALALPAPRKEGFLDNFVYALKDCIDGDLSLCLKEKAMKYTENLAASKELTLVEGITLANTGSPRSARSYNPLPEEPKARELQIEERIMDNVVDFLDNHVLQLRVPKAYTDDGSLEEEGRGKKKKKLKKLLPLLALLKLKIAALIPLFLGIIAFAVFKAYLLGKIAFMAMAISSLKKLLQSKQSSGWSQSSNDEHGWDNSGGGGGGGWGRASANDLAYSAHIKQA